MTLGNESIHQHIVKNLSSRVQGFYKLDLETRRKIVAEFALCFPEKLDQLLDHQQMDQNLLGQFIENPIGLFALPMGIATNFLIDGEDYLIPMAVEESSVVAACSYGAKLSRALGGFKTSATLPITTAQIQVFADYDVGELMSKVENLKSEMTQIADSCFPRLIERGGGVKDIRLYEIEKLRCFVVNLDVHTCDAMGANIVNTMAETVGDFLEQNLNLNIGLKILTNLSIYRRAKAECEIPAEAFATKEDPSGLNTIKAIEQAYLFARHDAFRAATHNKGIMNGIDPVVIATGNDWRAVEASAHAWAAHQGTYRSMSFWKVIRENVLYGCLDLPIPVGTVGGVTKLHPMAKFSLQLLKNPNAQALSKILCSVGLAQNLSAMRALSVEGIQAGHMRMHAKNLKLQKNESS